MAAETDPRCDVLFASESIGGRSSFKTSLCESKSCSNNSLSQPRLTSCQLLSMMSIVFVWYIQERDSWGSSSTLLSMSQHLSSPRTGKNPPGEYRNITIRVAWFKAGSCIFVTPTSELLSYHGKGQASLRCEWNWCPSNPSHTGFNFSGAESFCAPFKLLSSRWEDKCPFFFHVKW